MFMSEYGVHITSCTKKCTRDSRACTIHKHAERYLQPYNRKIATTLLAVSVFLKIFFFWTQKGDYFIFKVALAPSVTGIIDVLNVRENRNVRDRTKSSRQKSSVSTDISRRKSIKRTPCRRKLDPNHVAATVRDS